MTWIIKESRPHDSKDVLDYGCRNGHFSIAITNLNFWGDGVDIDAVSIILDKRVSLFLFAVFDLGGKARLDYWDGGWRMIYLGPWTTGGISH